MTRRRLAVAGGVAALVVAAIAVAALGSRGSDRPGPRASGSTSVASVQRGPLSSQVDQAGTLGYAARADGTPYSIVGRAAGSYTALPEAGDAIRCGRELYRVDDAPVVLLCGRTPAYRSLSAGLSGPDVLVLNRNLVALGYADRSQIDPSSDYFGAATAYALQRLQERLGVDQTGTLDPGQAVFLPGPLRITKVTATAGTSARPGSPVAQATTARRRVEAQLDASQASEVKAGDRAQITLPDNRSTPGVVTRVGTVATADGGDEEQSDAGSKIPVYVDLERAKDARGLDQAPVQVQITTAGVKDALSVPVTALVARAGGRYAVEAVGRGGARHLVPVQLGIFDHAGGRVQVTGPRLSAGQRVVVPAT